MTNSDSSRDSIFLLYHEMDSSNQPSLLKNADDLSVVVNIDDFIHQLSYLSKNNFDIISIDHALTRNNSTNNQVVITFDDGRKSDWSLAFPQLVKFGFPATFYIVSGKVDNDSEFVSSDNLKEMAMSNMTIGSHTVSHRFLPLLNDSEMKKELLDSRKMLEDIIQVPVKHLALPGGHANKKVFLMAKECGYESVATCKIGKFEVNTDAFNIPRLEVRRGLNIDSFAATFDHSKISQLRRIEFFKSILRNSLGLKNYTRLRRISHSMFNIQR